MTGEAATGERLARLGWPHLRKPFQLQDLLAEVHATIAAAHESTRIVRASLDRLFHTRGDLRRVIDALDDLRRRARETVARSRRVDSRSLIDGHAAKICAVKPRRRRWDA